MADKADKVETAVVCPAVHTKYQPTDAEWKCPKCAADGQQSLVCIDESVEGIDNCGELHTEDLLCCVNCGHAVSGKAFAAKIQKQHNLVTCPCCKGKGLVIDPDKPREKS